MNGKPGGFGLTVKSQKFAGVFFAWTNARTAFGTGYSLNLQRPPRTEKKGSPVLADLLGQDCYIYIYNTYIYIYIGLWRDITFKDYLKVERFEKLRNLTWTSICSFWGWFLQTRTASGCGECGFSQPCRLYGIQAAEGRFHPTEVTHHILVYIYIYYIERVMYIYIYIHQKSKC